MRIARAAIASARGLANTSQAYTGVPANRPFRDVPCTPAGCDVASVDVALPAGIAHRLIRLLSLGTTTISPNGQARRTRRSRPRPRVVRALTSAALTALLVLSQGSPANASPITVTTNGDSRAGDGLCSLREAITAANTDAPVDACPAGDGADEISVPAGTYLLTNAGPLEDANRSGDLDITAALTIRGAGPATTSFDGAALDRVLHIIGSIPVEISGVTIRNGLALLDGGAIHNGGTLLISNGAVGDSLASRWGGGIFNSGTMTLTNSTVSGNRAVGEIRGAAGDGGGIYNCGAESSTFCESDATVTVSDSTISGNRAGGGGGGIYNVRGTLTISGSTVSSNRAEGTSGGGIATCCHRSTATIADSTISGNAAGSDGGGIASGGVNALTVSDSTISDNSAGELGGGISVTYGGSMILTRSDVSRNTAGTHGGGIWNMGLATTVTISHSTVSGNRAGATGGGIANRDILTVGNSEISGNTAGAGGGGILNAYRATIDGSAITANTAAVGGGILNGSGGFVTLGGSTVTGNMAGSGGGIANCPRSGLFGCGEADVGTTTISGNVAASDGGGILNGGVMRIDTSTISSNRARRGGGIFNGGRGVALARSTASGNVADVGGAIFADSNSSEATPSTVTVWGTIVADSPEGGNCGRAVVSPGYIVSAGYSMSSDGTCSFYDIGDLNSTDPMLGPLTDNGGPTETHALQAGSPAIDAGHPACPPATDQRGLPRPADGNGDGVAVCDIGAYEADDPLLN